MVSSCHGFYGKMYFYLTAFMIHVFLIAYGYCDIEYNNFKIHKLLNALKSYKNFKSYPEINYFKTNVNSEENVPQNMNLDDYMNIALRSTSEMNFSKDKVETSKVGKLLRYQHRKKMEELIEFMRERYSSTNYFYNEMKRIQRQYTVKDKMREMIDYCEKPENVQVKEKILKLFDKIKKKHEKEQSLWNEPTNDLVINILKDPYNDGVVQ